MLHITNGGATLAPLERSGLPGACASWDDVLHEGRTVLASGEDWWRVRAEQLAAAGYGDRDEMLAWFREKGDPLDAAAEHDEVVLWFEHDLYDQLLLIHHLWWLSRQRPAATRFSIVIGTDYLGRLKPADFPPRFAARRAIADDEIAAGAAAWTAFCGDDPTRLVPLAHDAGPLPFLPRAMHRLLEEFPARGSGLGRTERQILAVVSEGARSPAQAFMAASRLEEDIWLGDWSFWATVTRLASAPHPLVHADVGPRGDHLPEGTLTITPAGRQVLAGRADHLALNAPLRWIGGTAVSPARPWRWTGSSVRQEAP